MASLFLSTSLLRRLPLMNFPARCLSWTEAAIVRGIWAISRLLPTDAASAMGAAFVGAIGPWTRKHHVLMDNLAVALPHVDAMQRAGIARGIWNNAGRLLAEFAILDRIVDIEGHARIEIVRHDALVDRSRGPVFYVAAHIANWNILNAVVAAEGQSVSIVGTAQRNPYLEAAMERMRRKRACFGTGRCRMIASKGAIREILRDVGQGRSIGWLLDQRHDQGDLVPFFGRLAPSATAPAALALRAGCKIVPIRVERLNGCRFRVTVHSPVSQAGLAELAPHAAALEVTRRINTLFEQWIIAQPDQWLCLKRRWPLERA